MRKIGPRQVFYFILLSAACKNPLDQLAFYEGKTMGTTYHVRIYLEDKPEGLEAQLKKATDSLLYKINMGISTYENNSLVSRFNHSGQEDMGFTDTDSLGGSLTHFIQCLTMSRKIFDLSRGAFDPTIMPLVNYWGFGYTGRHEVSQPDTQKINELLLHSGLDKIHFTRDSLAGTYLFHKEDTLLELDFGGIGQGYGADQIALLLDNLGYTRYLVELGGELVARGTKPDGSLWTVGLNTPEETAGTRDVFSQVRLTGKALTTSGNYRNFYKSGNQTFSHTINTKTGFPERSVLLSVTLIGNDCTSIDGMATACMALGMGPCREVLGGQDMEAYFIYRDGDHLRVDMTPGFKQYLIP
ncbi:MAG TPA: FAD:protein FMN transferase [Saprospiraceae bacterium]|nr:FAD:protein FMN transferase [Saprospiraceae bacterium]HNT21647.1 FAD:protein FMN transferase [Saprospiraceae bacterium]